MALGDLGHAERGSGWDLTCAFWCSGLRKLEPAMATSTQSRLRSSRLQVVRAESMVSAEGREGL